MKHRQKVKVTPQRPRIEREAEAMEAFEKASYSLGYYYDESGQILHAVSYRNLMREQQKRAHYIILGWNGVYDGFHSGDCIMRAHYVPATGYNINAVAGSQPRDIGFDEIGSKFVRRLRADMMGIVDYDTKECVVLPQMYIQP